MASLIFSPESLWCFQKPYLFIVASMVFSLRLMAPLILMVIPLIFSLLSYTCDYSGTTDFLTSVTSVSLVIVPLISPSSAVMVSSTISLLVVKLPLSSNHWFLMVPLMSSPFNHCRTPDILTLGHCVSPNTLGIGYNVFLTFIHDCNPEYFFLK